MSDISKLAREVLESDSTDTWEWRDAARQLATAYLEQQALIDSQHEVLVSRGQLAIERQAIIEQQQAENKRLREALEAVEWIDDDPGYCIWCHNYHKMGHAPDCQRQRALAQAGEQP